MDRRGATRFRLRLAVTYSWKDEAGVVTIGDGQSRDLSSRGIYVHVRSETMPPIGAQVEMDVSLPQPWQPMRPSELYSEGRVVRVEPESPAERAGFAVMSHTVILKDSQGRVVDGEDPWEDLGFDRPKTRLINARPRLLQKIATRAVLRNMRLGLLSVAERIAQAQNALRERFQSA